MFLHFRQSMSREPVASAVAVHLFGRCLFSGLGSCVEMVVGYGLKYGKDESQDPAARSKKGKGSESAWN